jgi:hypothetical protein
LEFQNNTYPNLKKRIDEAAGFDVPIDIDWASLAQPNDAAWYQEGWTKIYFEPVIGAFKVICADDLGKQALKELLKKVEIRNSGGFSDRRGLAFADGVLRVDQKLVNLDNVQDRTEGIVKLLEQAL